MNFGNMMGAARKFATDNSPAILTSLGVAGVVTTAVLTGKATLHSSRILGEAAYIVDEDGLVSGQRDMSQKEMLSLIWKEFIPPVVVGVATVTCIIGATSIGTRRAAAIAAAFKISEEMASEYKAKVVEKIGKKAEEGIREKVAEERMANSEGRDVIVIAGSEAVFYDAWSGRYFKSEYEKIRKAVNDVNHQVNNSYYASLTDFYDQIGLDKTAMSDEFGWSANQQLEIDFVPVMMPDNKVAIEISYKTEPIRGYDRVQ